VTYNIRYSCPDFDAAIDHIESARSINAKLRDQLDEVVDELQEATATIEKLKAEILDLQETIRDLEERQ